MISSNSIYLRHPDDGEFPFFPHWPDQPSRMIFIEVYLGTDIIVVTIRKFGHAFTIKQACGMHDMCLSNAMQQKEFSNDIVCCTVEHFILMPPSQMFVRSTLRSMECVSLLGQTM